MLCYAESLLKCPEMTRNLGFSAALFNDYLVQKTKRIEVEAIKSLFISQRQWSGIQVLGSPFGDESIRSLNG